MIVSVGRTLSEIVSILLGIGMIVGAFQATGLTGPLANELVHAGRQLRPRCCLLMGALTSFIFGMGMTVTACYIFLAVVLAPALVQAGLNELAVHLFILYWGMVSFITPPVALGAFSAATLAGANPMASAWEATRLGVVIYVIPFFFVLNPALIGQGPMPEVAWPVVSAFVGRLAPRGRRCRAIWLSSEPLAAARSRWRCGACSPWRACWSPRPSED